MLIYNVIFNFCRRVAGNIGSLDEDEVLEDLED